MILTTLTLALALALLLLARATDRPFSRAVAVLGSVLGTGAALLGLVS